MKSVCFTGHRSIPVNQELICRLQTQLKTMIAEGYTEFYAGGAIGWDMLCEQAVLSFRKNDSSIHLHLVLPCSSKEQVAKWTDTQKAEYFAILKAADSVEMLSEKYWNGCMKKRNAKLIEYADACVCYYNTNRIRSGTGQTVRMAEKKGIFIYNFADGA